MWVYGEAPGDLPYIELVRKNDRERKLRKGEETSYVRHPDIYHMPGVLIRSECDSNVYKGASF